VPTAQTPRWDVVGGGAASIDELVFVAGQLSEGKGRVVRREMQFGGNILTALVVAARAGAATAFIGCLPGETEEPALAALLRNEGVEAAAARVTAGARAIHSTVIVAADGERFIAFDDDIPVGMPDDLDLDLVRAARVLLLDDYAVAAGLRAGEAARAAGVEVVVDIERAGHPRTGELLDLANHVIVPLDFARRWTRAATPAATVQALWRDNRSAVVVTDGRQGCWYRAAEDVTGAIRHAPALLVAVVDTTGCGDAFHGGYAAALAQRADIAHCVEAATAAAADCATHAGGVAPALASVHI
jgi:sugar/nucleoside kinase (ribokinase family)